MAKKPELKPIEGGEQQDNGQTIPKPAGKFDINKFKSTRGATTASVEIQPSALSIMKMSDANDFVRLHPTEWSEEMCFTLVPTEGAPDSLHIIVEELAEHYLRPKKIIRHRLALATKPNNKFFLCIIPSYNLDNKWNADNLQACHQAKATWTQALSKKSQGEDGYEIVTSASVDAFPDPRWPSKSIYDLIELAFASGDRMIDRDDHPALDRLLGRKSQAT